MRDGCVCKHVEAQCDEKGPGQVDQAQRQTASCCCFGCWRVLRHFDTYIHAAALAAVSSPESDDDLDLDYGDGDELPKPAGFQPRPRGAKAAKWDILIERRESVDVQGCRTALKALPQAAERRTTVPFSSTNEMHPTPEAAMWRDFQARETLERNGMRPPGAVGEASTGSVPLPVADSRGGTKTGSGRDGGASGKSCQSAT